MSKLLDRKFLILMTFLLICCMSFSAITGAKYLGTLITVFEDFFGDVKKVLVAGAVIFVAVKGVQAAAGSDANGFVVTLFMVLFILINIKMFSIIEQPIITIYYYLELLSILKLEKMIPIKKLNLI